MFLAMAALLFQMASIPQNAMPSLAVVPVVATAAAPATLAAPVSAPEPAPVATPDPAPVNPSEEEAALDSPDAQPGVPYVPVLLAPEPVAPIIKNSPASTATSPFVVSVAELRAEQKHQQHLWLALSAVQHGAATFDAWSTRQVISNGGAGELNPMLRPFAGNASMYVAVQAGPAVLDYVSRRMMNSRHSWVRKSWWVPQALSTAASLASGAHNLSLHGS